MDGWNWFEMWLTGFIYFWLKRDLIDLSFSGILDKEDYRGFLVLENRAWNRYCWISVMIPRYIYILILVLRSSYE